MMGKKVLNEQLKTQNDATYQMIDITKIYPNPFQPRHIFDKDRLEELAKSIKKIWYLSTFDSTSTNCCIRTL
nr:ParB N-terminal domain-containing protein [Pediococcus pentosaceus]